MSRGHFLIVEPEMLTSEFDLIVVNEPDAVAPDPEALLAAAREEAGRAGRLEGYEQGYREGLVTANTRIGALIETLHEAQARIEEMQVMLPEALARTVVKVAVSLAERITGCPTAFDHQAALSRLLADAKVLAPPQSRIVVAAHPEFIDGAKNLLDRRLVWQQDPDLLPGGFRVEIRDEASNTMIARWDATIERRLEELRRSADRTNIAVLAG